MSIYEKMKNIPLSNSEEENPLVYWKDYNYLLQEINYLQRRMDKLESPHPNKIDIDTIADIVNNNLGRFYTEVVYIINSYENEIRSTEFSIKIMTRKLCEKMRRLLDSFTVRITEYQEIQE